MKFIRVLFYCSIVVICALFIALSSVNVQKFILKTGLGLYFKKSSVGSCNIGISDVRLTDIYFESGDFSVKVDKLSFKWTPFNILLKKGLRISDGSVLLSITGPDLAKNIPAPNNKENVEKSLAGFIQEKKFEGLNGPLSCIQPPFKTIIDDFYCKIIGNFGNAQELTANFSICGIKPKHVGNINFTAKLDFINKKPLADIGISGNGQLYENENGIFTKLNSNTKIHFNRKSSEYSPILFNLFSEKQQTKNGLETTQIEVHYGTSNDINLSCNFFKGGSTSFASKWILNLDHSILKLLGIKELPVVSILAEGDIRFDRNRSAIENNLYLSAWIKKLGAFSQHLAALPQLSFKTQLSTTHTDDLLKVNQFSATLKNKKTKDIFFDANLNHTLTFSKKLCRLLPLTDSSKILDSSFCEFPINLLKDFFNENNLDVVGTLTGFNFSLSWLENSKSWILESGDNLKINDFGVISNNRQLISKVNTNFYANCSINSAFDKFSWILKGKASDGLENQIIDINCSGTGALDKLSVKSIAINSDIKSSINSIIYQPFFDNFTSRKKLGNFNMSFVLDAEANENVILLKNFITKISENGKDVLNITAERGIALNKNKIKKGKLPKINGKLLTWSIDDFDLNVLSFINKDCIFEGTLFSHGSINSDGKIWHLNTEDSVVLKNPYIAIYNGKTAPMSLSCNKIEFLPKISYDKKNELSVSVKDIKCFLSENAPAFNADLLSTAKVDKDRALTAKSNINKLNTSDLLKICSGLYPTNDLSKFDVIDGLINIEIEAKTKGTSEDLIKNLHATAHLIGGNGVIRPLIKQSNVSKAVSGLTSALGLLASTRVKEMGSLGFFVSYIQAIPFAPMEISIEKIDDKILIKNSFIKNDEVRLSANGYIGIDSAKEFADQEVNIDVALNVKSGQIMNYITFDSSKADEFGYFIGPTLALKGTVGSPDYSEFIKLLNATKSTQNIAEKEDPKDNISSDVQKIFDSLF